MDKKFLLYEMKNVSLIALWVMEVVSTFSLCFESLVYVILVFLLPICVLYCVACLFMLACFLFIESF